MEGRLRVTALMSEKKNTTTTKQTVTVSCAGVNATSPGTGLESLPSDLPRGAAEIRARLDFSHAAAPRRLHNGGGFVQYFISNWLLVSGEASPVAARWRAG